MMLLHTSVASLAFLQSTQLNLFERFLTQAVSGITSTGVTAGMQKVAYVVLLVGFLWQVYQSALHGGDVRGLGTNLIKYVITAIVVMNYSAIFTTVNQGFVNVGNWINNASGTVNLFENWKTDLQTEFSQIGYQKLWGIVTGDIAGLIDGVLIIVAYLLYPIVIAVFGFFYIFYGSVLYIFGPIVIALMPLGATNRLAKAYIENVFIWNAWPVLYGGFGALLSAVQMGQIGQMLNQNNFLGGLGNIEGSILIGIASIIYSLAIAVIPFIAKRIVTGDVGSTAGALIGAAATAVTLGAAAVEGAAAGAATAGAGAPTGGSAGNASASAGAGRPASTTAGSNQPAPAQQGPRPSPAGNQPATASSPSNSAGQQPATASSSEPSLEGHAEQMRSSMAEAMGGEGTMGESAGDSAEDAGAGDSSVASQGTQSPQGSSSAGPRSNLKPSAATKRGPTVHRYNIGTWSAFHAARIATRGVATITTRSKGSDQE
jgi:hypothetical protein